VEHGPVELAVADGVATVTLNRPEARNAINAALLAALRTAMSEAGGREDVGCIVVTGADPAFCAGLDLKELAADRISLDDEDAKVPPGFVWSPTPVPVIGAVNGAAITGGLELALHCDFLVASERAVFADTHARVGVLPAWGLSVLLPERVGFTMARRMSFTGDFVDAHAAQRAGLVTEVVPHEQLLDRAAALARTIAANHRPAVAALVKSYRKVEEQSLGEGRQAELAAAAEYRQSGQVGEIGGRVAGVIERGRSQTSG
jgi:enoyl-CoA hydratase